jgi:hypothetical protein
MNPLRVLWLCSLALTVVLSGLPSQAQEEAQAPPPPALPPHTIPDGTAFVVRLDDTLDTSRLQSGKRFKAKLAEDMVGPDGTALFRGSKVHGHVSSVENGFHSRLLLSFDEIQTDHGWVPLIATVTGVPGEHGLKPPDEEGDIERTGPNKRRSVEGAAVGAGVGAVGGAAAGGGKGAAIGAGIGAGLGAAAGLLSDHTLRLQKGTVLEVRLDRPLQVPWR